MDNGLINGYVSPQFPTMLKTQTITTYSRQRRMKDFYDLPGQMYLALGKQTEWKSDSDESINDVHPPCPDPSQTFINELIGLQRIQWKMYAKPIINPTTDQKNQHVIPVYNSGGGITSYTDGYQEYAGVYYYCTSDYDKAIAEGCTCVMVYAFINKDDTFPYDITFRQTGLFVNSSQTSLYLSNQQFNNLPKDKRGYLELICNWPPHIRSINSNEQMYMLFSF